MRIKNKLITVHLIMTVTLFVSIVIFSQLITRNLAIKDAKINIGHLDSNISRFSYFLDTAINKRALPEEIKYDIEKQFDTHKEYITNVQESKLFTTSALKDQTKRLRLSYIVMDSKALQKFCTLLEESHNTTLNNLISSRGILGTLNMLESNPKDLSIDEKQISTLIEELNKMFKAHQDFKTEYKLYYNTWKDSKGLYLNRLNILVRRRAIGTVALLLVVIILAFYFGYIMTNVITVNLNEVNNSLARMTDGDFTTNLHIAAGDEFGDLSRKFNEFIQQLWKKLDSMNVIMSDIGHAMNEELDLNKIQTNILNNVTSHIVTDSAALFNLKDGVLKMTSSKGHFPPFFPIEQDLSNDRPQASRYLYENDIPLDTAIVAQCLESKSPVIIRDCENDSNFPQSSNRNSALYIHSLMMVPLINAGEILGLFVVLRTINKKPFSDLDYSNFSSFSDYAALTIDTLEKYNELIEKFEMQKEIGVAADIQQSLVPGKMPKIKGLSSSAYTLAAKGVSGDYYDFFRMNKYTIGATVCDVAGKGVPASLVMVMIRTILRLVSSPARGAAETLTMLNRSISGKIDVDRYATMAFFKIDLENMKLNYSNAAHHPIQIFRQSTQKFYAIDSPGLPIGIDRDATFSEKRISLQPGDIIFMYTDGFPEARNHDGDEYSTNRMLREIRLHCNSTSDMILDSVVKDMQKFTARAKQHDDQTILIIKIDEEKNR